MTFIGLLLYLKLARVDVGNISKKGENMKGIITWSILLVQTIFIPTDIFYFEGINILFWNYSYLVFDE